MKCRRPDFLHPDSLPQGNAGPAQAPQHELPDILTDCLSGLHIPFTNRDHIRQKALEFLINEKGYLKSDFAIDREIRFSLDQLETVSLVDISIVLNSKTLMAWKCASGSLVSRERQIIASARLLEDYVIPFAAVTNGKDLELIDALSEKVIGTGFHSVPLRDELIKTAESLAFRPVNKKKVIYEQRILHTYDAISCPSGLRK